MPEYDVLVVGGGVAGSCAALAAQEAGARVAIVSKTHPVRSHAASLGGFNASLSPQDSPAQHVRDSADTGAGLCELLSSLLTLRCIHSISKYCSPIFR